MLLSIRQIQSRIVGRVLHKLPALRVAFIDRANDVDHYRVYRRDGYEMNLFVSATGVSLHTQLYGGQVVLYPLNNVVTALKCAAEVQHG